MIEQNRAIRNDKLRAQIPEVKPPDVLVITRGVMDLGIKAVAEILVKVKEFSEFSEDNDPYGEHDFGKFECSGHRIFWKIDDHGGQHGYQLVLTVMLAEEY